MTVVFIPLWCVPFPRWLLSQFNVTNASSRNHCKSHTKCVKVMITRWPNHPTSGLRRISLQTAWMTAWMDFIHPPFFFFYWGDFYCETDNFLPSSIKQIFTIKMICFYLFYLQCWKWKHFSFSFFLFDGSWKIGWKWRWKWKCLFYKHGFGLFY